MKKMILYILSILIVAMFAYNMIANSPPKNPNKYKFLFRNDVFSSSKKETQVGDTIYQLAPVMRGKVYRPSYLYLANTEQYLVHGSVEPFGFRRYDIYAPPHPQSVKKYVLLNKTGQIQYSFDTFFNFSNRSGMFFTDQFYINWLESGDTTRVAYGGIYNQDLKMNAIQFADKFRALYAQADYTEFVNLRTRYSDDIGQGVVFRIEQKWYILLDGVYNSHIYGKLIENEKIGVDIIKYSLKFDYNDPDYKLKNPYPQSSPLIECTYLQTSDSHPYRFNRWASHDGLKMVRYEKQSSTGWQGIAAIKGIPIFVPGTGKGIAYMKYQTKKGGVYFKIPDVTKYDYRTIYNLGVRTFKLPKGLNVAEPLVFIESMQNFAHYLRDGGGVYVVRACSAENNTSLLPVGISEERYNELPLVLQIALTDIEGASQLKVCTWYPEITLLHNLNYLNITDELDSLPDEISMLKKLEVLDLHRCGLRSISPKIVELHKLKAINLYSNQLGAFPLELCELKELTELSIGGNKITEIPDNISNLTKLRSLNLFLLDNISLPETMLSMTGLKIEEANELKETLPEKFHFLFNE